MHKDKMAKINIPGLKGLPSLLPHRVRRKWRATKSRMRSRQSPASSITALQTSFSFNDTLKSLRDHKWSHYDAQYIMLAVAGIFCLCMIQEPGPLFKTFVATLLMSSLLFPITRQFFLPFLPIAAYLVLFFTCKFIPAEYRPPIWVRVLPTLENVLYGANLSNILSAHKHVVLDILAWLPYGVGHFAMPFITAIVLFIFGPPGTLPVYARAFGYMSFLGVVTNLVFPCSPPWYENKYGLVPATYKIHGEAAGLARIDELFGIDLYVPGFGNSPSPFGAFPSLHAADATLEALFLGHVFPHLFPAFLGYVLWLWWATMYLSHHYAVDLVAGSLLAAIFFFISRQKFLPRVQFDKFLRWDYDYVEIGEPEESFVSGMVDFYEEFQPISDSDEWTIGSSTSSSFSSGALSPGSGSHSPIEESHNHKWETRSTASGSGSDHDGHR